MATWPMGTIVCEAVGKSQYAASLIDDSFILFFVHFLLLLSYSHKMLNKISIYSRFQKCILSVRLRFFTSDCDKKIKVSYRRRRWFRLYLLSESISVVDLGFITFTYLGTYFI